MENKEKSMENKEKLFLGDRKRDDEPTTCMYRITGSNVVIHMLTIWIRDVLIVGWWNWSE